MLALIDLHVYNYNYDYGYAPCTGRRIVERIRFIPK